jgi:predicted secreted protein
MPYTNSQAGIGLGSVLSVNTSVTTTPTWTPVAELNKLAITGRQAGTADVTNFQSLAREFKSTLISSGNLDITGNRIGGDAGQVAMETNFTGLLSKSYKLQLVISGGQTTTGDSYVFLAIVEKLNYSVEVDKAVSADISLKISGIMTLTAGS